MTDKDKGPGSSGQSVNVKLSKDLDKKVQTKTGAENAPRDISHKEVNQKYSVKTGGDVGTASSERNSGRKPATVPSNPHDNAQKEKKSVSQSAVQNKPRTSRSPIISGSYTKGIVDIKRKVQDTLETQNDGGTKTLSVLLSTSETSYKVYKGAQYLSPYIAKSVNKTIPTARKIKTAVDTAQKYTFKIGNNAFKLTRGIATGGIKVNFSKSTLAKLKKIATLKLEKSKRTGEQIIKGGFSGGLKIGKGISRGFEGQILNKEDSLTKSDDVSVQTLGYYLKSAHYAAKGVKYVPQVKKATYQGVKTGFNTAIKTGKTITKTYNDVKVGSNIIKRYGIKKATKSLGNQIKRNAVKTLAKAGSSAISAVFDGIKSIGIKFILPIILILLLVACGSNLISSFGTIVASVFSPYLSDENGAEVDEMQWLTSHITTKRNALIQDVKSTYNSNLVANGGNYHYVRFFNAFSDEEVELTDTNINTSIYSVTEYQQYIQPVFHTLIMSEYDMQASEAEMQSVLDDLWNRITIVKTEELPIEYCYNATQPHDDCGYFLADIVTCPNYTSGKHDSYTCDVCCYIEEHSDTSYDGEGNEITDEWESEECNGWYHCEGHRILKLTIELKGFGDLINDYYLTEINQLEAKANLTTDEQKRLLELKDYYEICINYLTVLGEEFGFGNGDGGGGSLVDLDGVSLTELTDYACQFIGNPYVWGGTDPNRGADCSGFVKYVYAHFGVQIPRVSRDQAGVGTTIVSISEAKPGDLIFYSETGTDSGVYHVTMYLGNGKMVHASNSKPYPQGGIKISNVYGTIYKIKRIAN